MKLNLTINNRKKTLDVPANRTLLDLLRSLGLWTVKHGCETGDCGNCSVKVGGRAVYSCLMLAAQANGKTIETYEQFIESEKFQPLRDVFMEYGDADCDYCTPGFMMSMKALLDVNIEPTEEEVVEALAGVVCRCSNKAYPVDAIMAAIKKMRRNW